MFFFGRWWCRHQRYFPQWSWRRNRRRKQFKGQLMDCSKGMVSLIATWYNSFDLSIILNPIAFCDGLGYWGKLKSPIGSIPKDSTLSYGRDLKTALKDSNRWFWRTYKIVLIYDVEFAFVDDIPLHKHVHTFALCWLVSVQDLALSTTSRLTLKVTRRLINNILWLLIIISLAVV